MYDLKKHSKRYAQEQRLAKLQIKHVQRMDKIRAGQIDDWNEILIATAYALIGFAVGSYTAFYLATPVC